VNKQVAIILGSESDLDAVKESKLPRILQESGIEPIVHALSAHRHSAKLKAVCDNLIRCRVRVFIAIVGKLPGLPGAIAATINEMDADHSDITKLPIVLGVQLSSSTAPAHTMLMPMASMPGGIDVATMGPDDDGLQNAALMATKLISLVDEDVATKAKQVRSKLREAKPPQLDLSLG